MMRFCKNVETTAENVNERNKIKLSELILEINRWKIEQEQKDWYT